MIIILKLLARVVITVNEMMEVISKGVVIANWLAILCNARILTEHVMTTVS